MAFIISIKPIKLIVPIKPIKPIYLILICFVQEQVEGRRRRRVPRGGPREPEDPARTRNPQKVSEIETRRRNPDPDLRLFHEGAASPGNPPPTPTPPPRLLLRLRRLSQTVL